MFACLCAWHRHSLGGDGKVRSVATISSPDGLEDTLWAIVEREINGSTVQYIEYMTSDPDEVKDSTYLDSMISYNGAGVTSLSGLNYLEGETVDIIGDGVVLSSKKVENGSVTLEKECVKVHVGLGYKSLMQTQDIESGAADGTAQGKKKRISRMHVRLLDSVGLKYGPSLDKLDQVPFRKFGDKTDEAVPFYSGTLKVDMPLSDNENGYVFLVQEQPLPLTVLAIMPELRTNKG